MKRLLLAIACIALAACNANDAGTPLSPADLPSSAVNKSVTLDQPFELRVGRTATVAGESLTVSFEGVPEDSRCPTGVQCVWAGNARVQVVLSKDGKAAGVELNTGVDPRTANYLDYQIELVNLEPYPSIKGGPIPQSQYRATFVVRKPAA
jgi:hypothetical protein